MVGHSSGELLALAAAGVFPADRVLEQKLGRLGSIFRGFESSGDLPAARLVAVAADRQRVEAICRDVGAKDAAVAMDNCPHQVVLAVSPAEFEPIVVARLRGESILWESSAVFACLSHPELRSGGRPDRRVLQRDDVSDRQTVPIYSCASRRRMPDDVDAIRELAVEQWTTTVAFRETIEAMHADGLRLFVDVGARGNLAGFVEDILRGKPAFAIAANLPRRSGLTQLNHLVASTFAQGVSLTPDYLYARRRPRAIDWNAPEPPARATVDARDRFPPNAAFTRSARAPSRGIALESPHRNIRLTKAWKTAVDPRRYYLTPASIPARNGNSRHDHDRCRFRPRRFGAAEPRLGTHEELIPGIESRPFSRNRLEEINDTGSRDACRAADLAMLSFQHTMQAFLQTQQEVMAAYLDRTPMSCPRWKSLRWRTGFALGDDHARGGCSRARSDGIRRLVFAAVGARRPRNVRS